LHNDTAEHEVLDVRPTGAPDGSDGYAVTYRSSTRLFRRPKTLHTTGLVFAGGVLGTVRLLLQLRKRSLPRLSEKVGFDIRTNNESLLGITSLDQNRDLSTGIAIGSILHTDPDSHLEVCRYSKGSGAWRLSMLPFVEGPNLPVRVFRMLTTVLKRPGRWLRYLFVRDWARSSVVLLFMQTLDSTLRLDRNRFGWMRTRLTSGERPSAFIPQAETLARRYARLINGEVTAFALTPLAGIPGTAHILGGAVMGATPETGVIDADNRVFGYENMLVCDGAMISANPGVNPSLSITAIAERAIDKIPSKRVDFRADSAIYSAPSQT
jgi:cholesterol oxidase